LKDSYNFDNDGLKESTTLRKISDINSSLASFSDERHSTTLTCHYRHQFVTDDI
jgi:hypothetical protein